MVMTCVENILLCTLFDEVKEAVLKCTEKE